MHALDRVLRIVGELDRYHGFGRARPSRPLARRGRSAPGPRARPARAGRDGGTFPPKGLNTLSRAGRWRPCHAVRRIAPSAASNSDFAAEGDEQHADDPRHGDAVGKEETAHRRQPGGEDQRRVGGEKPDDRRQQQLRRVAKRISPT